MLKIIDYREINNLVEFTSKQMPNNILVNVNQCFGSVFIWFGSGTKIEKNTAEIFIYLFLIIKNYSLSIPRPP